MHEALQEVVEGSETERLAAFRQVRDAIEAELRTWLAASQSF